MTLSDFVRVVEVVRDDRLRRSAVADLIRHDHPKALFPQRLDDVAEIDAGEVLPWKRTTVWPLAWRDGATSLKTSRASRFMMPAVRRT
jgi:hypothetical protein